MAEQPVSLHVNRWPAPAGERARLYLLHGFGEHSGRYGQLAAELNRAGISLIAPDHRGHGRSPGQRAFVPAADTLARDFLDCMAMEPDSGLPQFLMGHSMGGAVAVQVALAGQDRWDGLVLSSPYLVPAEPPPRILESLVGVISRLLPNLTVERLSSADLSREPAEAAAYDEDPLVHHGGVSARSAHSLLSAGAQVLVSAGQLELPLLILHGAEDRIAGIEGSRQLLAAAGSRERSIIEFEAARHEVMNDLDRSSFFSALTDWLDHRLGGTDEDLY